MSFKKLALVFVLLGGVSSELLAADFLWVWNDDVGAYCRESLVNPHLSFPNFPVIKRLELYEMLEVSKLEELMKDFFYFMQIKKNVTDLTANAEKLAENLFFLTHYKKFNLDLFKIEIKNIINQIISKCKALIGDCRAMTIDTINEELRKLELDPVEDAEWIEELQAKVIQYREESINVLEGHIQFCENMLKLFL
jgi:hypothetical protein